MIVKANVEVGACTTRKRKRNLLFAWDYHDETCHGGDGGGESVSDVDVDVVLSTDGHIRARIGHSGMGREREIFISLWLQVCVTGPRHHLAGSLLTKRRGHDEKGIFTWVTSMVV